MFYSKNSSLLIQLMETKISIVICTYNPNKLIFEQCLNKISKLIEDKLFYEIIIVNNNSTNGFENETFFKLFLEKPQVRLVIEKEQGLTPARLRGIQESNSDLLCFIDDDNFVGEDFFLNGLKIEKSYPFIGAWSGQVNLIFEKEPEAWTKKYWGMLVYRKFEKDKWSNLANISETMPCGAGLFIRKTVANYYLNLHQTGKRNLQLDRSGDSLFSGGDDDLATCSIDIGLGVGLFRDLKLDHFIPEKRISQQYLISLAEGIATSAVILNSFRNNVVEVTPNFKNKMANYLRWFLISKIDRKIQKAVFKGEQKGFLIIKKGLQNLN